MQNFEFYNPTRIVFGKDTIAKLAEHVPAEARTLILYGGSSAEKNGTLAEVRAALAGRVFQEFGGIEPNPTYETLMRAVETIRRDKLDFLLAVGGGSVIDGTKFVAAAVAYTGDAWDILTTHGACVGAALPFGTVLTLPATGSEMNSSSVITRSRTREKLAFGSPHVFPRFSVLDPTKTYSLPLRQVANGVVDSFVHIMEQYLTYPAGGMAQDRFAEGLLQSLIEIGPKVIAQPDNYDLRANFMWIATLALNGLIGAGVPQDWATHMIGHEVTARYDIDHARTLAVVLPAMLRIRKEAKRGKLLQYAQRVWNLHDGSEDERIEAAIARTEAFFESLDIPTRLSAYTIGADAIDDLIAQLDAHGMTALGEREEIGLDVSRRVLEAAL
ncbi:iron-containing alcohol dehydrogenase [Acetobacter sp. TBRC 12305]|uniref:Iron-containing alcohol dehydrogenase n=1 Tax=Acetobacter garciniae TaxID=2817435 RepID=A0A939HLK1_9PROT|nr:iron-containing alcohol dehydrogenase [Acetobacter garciniae]MBO1326675.1 iron-containing alcohol dehydrogenase [Acetobacter garciniae]MBX0345030.1 iron-containing alcohol dehydrogenase [Acetobacter garciniae]